MLIEITGAGFHNKGAELMLRETVRRVRGSMPEASLAVSPSAGAYPARAELGLYQNLRYLRYRIDWGKFAVLMPRCLRNSLGVVTGAEVDATLDASGYAYGDSWGSRSLAGLARRARQARSKGTTLIFLPQAFGPFRQASKPYMQALVENADLIYPRDEVSYRWIVDLAGRRDNVRIAPDFTATLPGFLRPAHRKLAGRFCVIPNNRMLDKTPPEVRDGYIPMMRQCVACAREQGVQPYLLIHEAGDVALAERIAEGLHTDIVAESDACAIKGIIGAASALVSSRFHGLVNALSQGVPALGTGWSHKYEMLFRDYGMEDGLVSVPCDGDQLQTRLDLLLDPTARESLTLKLRKAADRQRKAIDTMWRDIFTVLRAGASQDSARMDNH